jgi:hypothetical protein
LRGTLEGRRAEEGDKGGRGRIEAVEGMIDGLQMLIESNRFDPHKGGRDVSQIF